MKLADPNSAAAAASRRSPDSIEAPAGLASMHKTARVTSGLEALIRARVIPELAARHGIGEARVHPRAAELAGLLLAGAIEPVQTLLAQAAGRTELSLRTTLLEPAARLLGDEWLDDRCSDSEIILGLGLLHSAARRVASVRAASGSPGRVLVALLPGETHLLGVALASDTLHGAGWGVTVAFPDSVAALVAQLRSARFDALHLTLSDALPREESLPLLRRAIRMARSATTKRKLPITVNGRLFAEGRMRPTSVGADALLPATA